TPTLTTTPTPTATPTPGPCQRYEPNNSPSSAFGPLANGSVIEAALCDGDPEDYYQVALAGAATLKVDLDNLPAGTDYDLYLYDATSPQNYLAQSTNDGTTPESIQINLPSGSYVLRIYPSPRAGRSTQPYRLAVQWLPLTGSVEPRLIRPH
ncbi:MAG: pre-peptidase C-terminal domain-containing protein, partial [Caldilineales bacterium]|nr:pre-peptidase C-terminal domain-containing protein [Caldilineales bacterium]